MMSQNADLCVVNCSNRRALRPRLVYLSSAPGDPPRRRIAKGTPLMSIHYHPLGRVRLEGDDHIVEIDPAFRPGLVGIGDFKWIILVWHADQYPPRAEDDLVLPAPYKNAPEKLGVFSTRTPVRPNPVCVTVAALIGVDYDKGILRLGWIDCEPDTPILDIKPYQPAADRVETPDMPDWCANWPKSLETSADFDWASVFNC
jgi:tRNA (Thr-GGU) A37 N-methylase